MKPRFQADADLDRRIVAGLLRLEPAIDFQTGPEAGFEGVPDSGVLNSCAAEGRVLVTHDARTMPRHFAEFIAEHQSPGVIIVSRKVPISIAISELCLIWAASEAEEWRNVILRLPL